MSFLNRSVLQERAAAATVEKHPLLKESDVPPNVKQAYLQGCVLAVLERDDGKVKNAARQELLRIGKSLEMSDADCAEAISIVSALQTPEDQGQFLDELFAVLAGETYPKFFMRDFQSLIAKDGQMTDDKMQTVDHFGRSLTGRSDWQSRSASRCEQAEKTSVKNKRAFKSADPLFQEGMGRVVYEVLVDFLQKRGRTEDLFAAMTFREVGLTDAQMEEISDSVGNVFSDGGLYVHCLIENIEMLDLTIGDFIALACEYFGGMMIDVLKCNEVQKCTECARCTELCPVDAIAGVDKGPDHFYIINREKCVACGVCVSECPNGAISSFEDRLNALPNRCT